MFLLLERRVLQFKSLILVLFREQRGLVLPFNRLEDLEGSSRSPTPVTAIKRLELGFLPLPCGILVVGTSS